MKVNKKFRKNVLKHISTHLDVGELRNAFFFNEKLHLERRLIRLAKISFT